MINLRRIIKNTVISFLGRGINLISTLLLSIAYGRFLGAFAFGELYFAIMFVYVVGILIDGFSNQITRDVAQKPESASRYFSNVLLIKLGGWLIIYTVILLLSWLLGYSFEVRTLIAICGIDLLCNAIVKTFVTIQYALERTFFPIIGDVLEKGLVSLLGFLLLRAGAGVEVMAVVLVGGSLVNVLWEAIWYLRLVGTGFAIDPKLIGKLVRADFPFLISAVLAAGCASIDTILISLMENSTVVGLYGAAARITDVMNFLPSTVMFLVMYPVIAKLATTSDTEMKLAIEKSMNFLLFCVMPIATMFIVAAPNIIRFLYGSGFAGAVPVLQVLGPYLIFLFINYVLVTVVLSKRQDKFVPISMGAALVFNIGLNLILIPLFQHIGAAIVALLTEFLLCCMNIFIIPRSMLPLGSLRVAFKALIASLLMATVIIPLHTLHIFVILPLAMVAYIGTAFLLGVIPREDYLVVYNTFLRKRKRSTSPSTGEMPEISALTYDLPTMPLPAFFGDIVFGGTNGTLLDIQMAITNQLPIIRLPLAPPYRGLITRGLSGRLPDTPIPSRSSSVKPEQANCDEYSDDSFDLTTLGTEALPAIHPHSEQLLPFKIYPDVTEATYPLTQQRKEISS